MLTFTLLPLLCNNAKVNIYRAAHISSLGYLWSEMTFENAAIEVNHLFESVK